MNGHVRRRSPGSFELRWRQNERTRTMTIRTTSKRVADARLRELMVAADRGEHVQPSRLTVAQLVAQRIEAWHPPAASHCGPQSTIAPFSPRASSGRSARSAFRS